MSMSDPYPPAGQGSYPLNTYLPMQPAFRDQLDARRSMWRRTPDAEYPDGYLGSITSRRGDRLLNNLKATLNKRSYDRGVHKGERLDPGDYFWPPEFSPDRGLMHQALGVRQAPLGPGAEVVNLMNDGKMPANIRAQSVGLQERGNHADMSLSLMGRRPARQLQQFKTPWS